MDKLRNFGFLIKDIGRLYTKLFEQRASHLEVTLAQCRTLIYISKNQGISQIRLAALIGIEPMSLVRILDRMEADGWIERRAHPADRRARQLYLKAKAQPTLEQIWKTVDAVSMETLAGFKVDERNQLLELLARAHTNLLEAKLDEAPSVKASSKPQQALSQATKAVRLRGGLPKAVKLRVASTSRQTRKPLRHSR